MPQPLILASTSPYRVELLQRLGLHFSAMAPDCDESLRADELPAARAERLAWSKARSVAARCPGAWVLGSDQVCAIGTQVLRKPGTAARQREQLAQLAGAIVTFHTVVALVQDERRVGHIATPTQVQFRALSAAEIDAYVEREPAADCAGGFKAEALGISLCDWIRSDDPTALIGLPLIGCARLLREQGVLTPP